MNTKLQNILDELRENLVKTDEEAKELSFQVDKDWIKELKTSNNENYTYEAAIKEAKVRRSLILEELKNNSSNTNLQLELTEKLTILNKAINGYELKKEEIKNKKAKIEFDDTKAIKKVLIEKGINANINEAEEEITTLRSKKADLIKKLNNVSDTEMPKVIKDLSDVSEKIVNMDNFKKSCMELLSYNGKIISPLNIDSTLTDEQQNIIKEYAKIITSCGINMKGTKAKKDTPDETILEEVTKLVEKAEASKDEEDINKAKAAVNSLKDSKEKDELLKRLNNIKKDNEEALAIIALIEKILDDTKANRPIDKNDMKELRNKYQLLSKEDASRFEKSINSLTKRYNNQIENELKSKIDETDLPKHKLSDYIVEIIGKPIAKLFLGSTLVKKINKRRLEKKLKDYEEASEEEKETKLSKLNKVRKTIADAATISGVRLFKSRNNISKLKPKLYKGELTEKEEGKLESSQLKFENKMLNGLFKKEDKKYILENRVSVLNILNQYLENASISVNFDEAYNAAIDFINEPSHVSSLEENDIKGFKEQLDIIKFYRDENNKAIYEYDSDELTDVIRYYDEDVKTQNNVLKYMK